MIACLRAGVIVAQFVQGLNDANGLSITVVSDGSCSWGAQLHCKADRFQAAASYTWRIGVLLYWALYAISLYQAYRSLQSKLYQMHRLANLALRLHVRAHLP